MISSVMYHYVRPVENSELRYLSVDDFDKQLDWLSANVGDFISRENWENAKQGAPQKGVLLTFDDGLKDHFSHVLPILQRKNLFAIFFVNTQPLLSPVVLAVHMTHLLLSTGKSREILDLFTDLLPKKIWRKIEAGTAANAYSKQLDTDNNKSIKKLVNYLFDEFNTQEILEGVCEKILGKSIEQISRNWYLSVDEVLQLHDSGMKIGSHSVTHRLLSKLSPAEMYAELESSKLLLEEITDSRVDEFCYPYGGERSYTNLTHRYLDMLDYSVAHDVNPKPIAKSDFETRFSLPRFDCNDFPFGIAQSLKSVT
jgi:peptidoglycan/xylan/chitin deacetylase (PgdA/CDA1 family)